MLFAHLPHTLLTPRLRLRPWRPADWADFAALNADAEVMRYFPTPLSRAQSDAMANEIQRRIARQGWGFWAAEHLESRSFIGMIGLNTPTPTLPFSTLSQPCVEVGWRLARPWWSQGLATEGARAALDFAFQTLRLPEVVSFTAVPNLPSAAVMQRLGMQRDPATFEHPALPTDHPLRSHVLYRLTAPQPLTLPG